MIACSVWSAMAASRSPRKPLTKQDGASAVRYVCKRSACMGALWVSDCSASESLCSHVGLLVGMLRFIPYIGPAVGVLMPIALSMAVFPGWVKPFLVGGLFVLLEIATNALLEPLLYGRGAGVSQAILMSIAFWAWLWGLSAPPGDTAHRLPWRARQIRPLPDLPGAAER